MAGSGTARQITVGGVQLPLSEAPNLVTLYATPVSTSGAIAGKTVTLSGGSNVVSITSGTTSDLYIGCPVSASSYFPTGTVVSSVLSSSSFTTSNAAIFPIGTSISPATPGSFISYRGSNMHYSDINYGGSGSTNSTYGLVGGLPVSGTTILSSYISEVFNDTTYSTTTNSNAGLSPATGSITTVPATFITPSKTISVTGGGTTCSVSPSTSGLTAGMLMNTSNIYPSGIFPASAFIASVTDSSTIVASSSAYLVDTGTVTFNKVAPRGIATTSGSTTVTLSGNPTLWSTSDLILNMPINSLAFPTSAKVSSILSATSFVASTPALISSSYIDAFSVPTRNITTTYGSTQVVVPSTEDLYASLPINSNVFPNGTTISSIPSATSFVASASATYTGTSPAFNTIPSRAYTVTGGSNIISTTSNYSNNDIYVGMNINSIHFPLGTTVTATGLGSLTVSSTALVRANNITSFMPFNRNVSGSTGNTTLTVSSSAGLFVGQKIASPVFTKGKATIVSINSNTSITTDIAPDNNGSLNAIEVPNANALYSFTGYAGSNLCSISSTSSLFVGMPVASTYYPRGTVISAITSATGFTTSNAASASSVTSVTLSASSEDYLMFKSYKTGSDNYYQVPAGKTFTLLNVAFTYPSNLASAYAPSLGFGYGLTPITPDTGGRIRTHTPPSGLVLYSQPTDAGVPSSASPYPFNITFPAGTYALVKLAASVAGVNFSIVLTGLEL